MRTILRILSCSLWGVAILGLIFPMPVLADATGGGPQNFGVTYLSAGLSFELVQHGDEGYTWTRSDGHQGHLDRSAMEAVEILEARGEDGRLSLTFELPADDGNAAYAFEGTSQDDGSVVGWLVGLHGEAQMVRLDLPQGVAPLDVVDTVGPAFAIGILVCAIVAYYTNCISDCSSACSNGMQSASEGFCGRCTCTCKQA